MQELTIISLFFFRFKIDIAKCNAVVPLETEIPYLQPQKFAKSLSKFSIDFENVPDNSFFF